MTASITLTGRLTAEPELRFSPSGVAMTKFTVVTDRRRRNNDTGEWESVDTTFWRCTAFNALAEQIAERELAKGQAVLVSGRARQNDWTDRDGNQRSAIEVNVDNMGPDLRWPPKASQRAQPQDAPPADDAWAGSPPAGQQPASDEPPF